jgi:ATP-dependent helicase/nuclease subunit B
MQPSPEGLFSVDEKEYFRNKGFALGSLDDIKMQEEDAAMYRMLSRPSDKLYISWSMTDSEGSELSPSSLIDSLKMLLPCLEKPGRIHKDAVSAGWGDAGITGGTVGDLIDMPGESMRHMIDRIKDRNAPEGDDPLMRSLLSWYSAENKTELDMMLAAAGDENIQRPLGKDIAGKLFGRSDGSLVLSASSIGSYFDCPFRYFIDRGLRPKEERDFSSDPRSIGDAYHECLMSVARRLLGDRELLKRIAECRESAGTAGMPVPEDVYAVVQKMVDEELAAISENYEGGLFISTGNEKFRMERIREICSGAARAMADQLSSESLVEASFEEPFSRKGGFSPVTLEVDG